MGVAQVGVVYTGKHGKIAEHGGANPDDLHVPLIVSGAHIEPDVDGPTVETTQIAPTILGSSAWTPSPAGRPHRAHAHPATVLTTPAARCVDRRLG